MDLIREFAYEALKRMEALLDQRGLGHLDLERAEFPKLLATNGAYAFRVSNGSGKHVLQVVLAKDFAANTTCVQFFIKHRATEHHSETVSVPTTAWCQDGVAKVFDFYASKALEGMVDRLMPVEVEECLVGTA